MQHNFPPAKSISQTTVFFHTISSCKSHASREESVADRDDVRNISVQQMTLKKVRAPRVSFNSVPKKVSMRNK